MLESNLIMLTGSQIRRKFLDFFVAKGHREVHSSSLVPRNEPTLLFTNAGMNQFKVVFFGLEERDYAWELITSKEWFGIPKDKLYVTVFKGEGGVPQDEEAYEWWVDQGVAEDRIFEFGLKDNFWQMGDTGPCGPCSEIHYDMGPAASDQGHADCAFGCDCGRYVEIWNLVFMQFDRDASGKLNPLPKPSIDTGMGLERVTAVLQGVISNYETDLFVPLIKGAAELTGHVGPGLRPAQAERSSAAISKTGSGASLRRAGEGTRPYASSGTNHGWADALVRPSEQKSAASLRVIADHSRAATFLISDGVLPSNEGRGYVLRKIIRRAITPGRLLGQTKPFLHEMVFSVRDLMQDAYPELKESADRVSKAIHAEETRFAHTLDSGLKQLEDDLFAALSQQIMKKLEKEMDAAREDSRGLPYHEGLSSIEACVADLRNMGVDPVFPGGMAFKLYDTFGMPLDFMQDAARDQGIA